MGYSQSSPAQWKRPVTMRPFVALSLILASAMGAPSGIIAPAGVVATHGVVANTVGAAVTQSHGPAPLATHPLKAGPVVPHPVNYVAPPAPAPSTTRLPWSPSKCTMAPLTSSLDTPPPSTSLP